MAIGMLASVSLDCADPGPLARFWAEMTGGEIAFEAEEFTAVKLPSGSWLAAVVVADYRPPTWPDAATPKQFHLDIAVDDLDVAEQGALDLGATKPDHQPGPDRWRVLLDPAGHPFCLTGQIPE